jgi:hypothetical protein
MSQHFCPKLHSIFVPFFFLRENGDVDVSTVFGFAPERPSYDYRISASNHASSVIIPSA